MIIKTLYLYGKEMRFNELLINLKPISSKTLSAKLKELAKVEIINRNVIPETPIRIRYELTEKGRDLNEILDAMAAWSIKWNMEELK